MKPAGRSCHNFFVSLALDSEVPAFRKIFDEHAPVVRRYLTVRMKNAALAY